MIFIPSHAIPTVGPDCRVRVHFAGDDADVEVVLRAPRLFRALAQAAHAHLIRARSRQVLAHAEKPARFFSLAPDLLQGNQMSIERHRFPLEIASDFV